MLKLGVIGMSEGNGHPYSWSAIFNGYDKQEMSACPFPVIPEYLAKQNFPAVQLGGARVTHIWTQDLLVSNAVARAANIDVVCGTIAEMVSEVDAVLLARDDAENHVEFAGPFLEAGLPVYVDKPVALSTESLDELYALALHESQIFSCSALRYASEFQLSNEQKGLLGDVKYFRATIMKSWQKYAVHIIDPVLSLLDLRHEFPRVSAERVNGVHVTSCKWNNIAGDFVVAGSVHCPLAIDLFGSNGSVRLEFSDSFNAFRNALETFVHGVQNGGSVIPKEDQRVLVHILEEGAL